MHFETNTELLRQAIITASRFAERKPNLPALGGVLIVAENNTLLLRATNLECGVEITVPAKISEAGTVVIPAHILSSFISNVRGKTISISKKGEVATVETEQMKATIKTLSADDFPILPRVSASTSFTIKSSDLSKAIKNVAYCASTSTIKPELQSILLVAHAGKLSAAATDSFRLAEKTVPFRTQGSVPKLLIPAKNATELVRLLDSFNGEIEVYYNENQISAHIQTAYFTSRLIDGSFPDYQQIVPKTHSTNVVVLREDFAHALKSLSIFTDKLFHLSFTIDTQKKLLVLASHNPEVGEQTSTMHATLSGEGATMSFNSKYLNDSLQALNGESIRIQSNGPGKAILIKDAADESFFYLVMPMNR